VGDARFPARSPGPARDPADRRRALRSRHPRVTGCASWRRPRAWRPDLRRAPGPRALGDGVVVEPEKRMRMSLIGSRHGTPSHRRRRGARGRRRSLAERREGSRPAECPAGAYSTSRSSCTTRCTPAGSDISDTPQAAAAQKTGYGEFSDRICHLLSSVSDGSCAYPAAPCRVSGDLLAASVPARLDHSLLGSLSPARSRAWSSPATFSGDSDVCRAAAAALTA
jgi:hypothetical protein